MTTYRTYSCPDCSGVFTHCMDHELPKFCPLCATNLSTEVKKRHYRKRDKNVSRGIASKSVDGLYRQMENASEYRQEQAAEMLGVDKSTLSNMKMTDMKDNVREGDFTSQSTLPSDTAKLMGSPVPDSGMNMTFQDKSAGAEYAKQVSQGPNPNASRHTMNMITSKHQTVERQLVSAGRQNSK